MKTFLSLTLAVCLSMLATTASADDPVYPADELITYYSEMWDNGGLCLDMDDVGVAKLAYGYQPVKILCESTSTVGGNRWFSIIAIDFYEGMLFIGSAKESDLADP